MPSYGGPEGRALRRSPHDGPDAPFEGPDAPFEGPHTPFEGPDAPFEGPHTPFEGPHMPFEGPECPHAPFEGPDAPFQGPDAPFKGPDAPFEGPHAPFEGPECPHAPFEGPDAPFEGPDAPFEVRTVYRIATQVFIRGIQWISVALKNPETALRAEIPSLRNTIPKALDSNILVVLRFNAHGECLTCTMSTTTSEPGRRKAYSADLRWRIVFQRISMNLKLQAIAKNLNVSTATCYRICSLFERTGDV